MISAILESRLTNFLARLLLTFMFWSSGIAKLVDWNAGLADMAHFNLRPEVAYNAATALTEIGGSLLILFGPYAWLGAGWLGIFTVLTIPIAHNFWTMTGPQKTAEMYVAVEHLSMVGGLILAAILRHRDRR